VSIRRNPYGVGFSGEEKWREGKVRCTCCAIPFAVRYNIKDPEFRGLCTACEPHVPLEGESAERRAERAEEHNRRLWKVVESSARHAAERRAEVERAHEKTRFAYESRDGYRDLLAKVAQEHTETSRGCSCGRPGCRTQRLLDDSRYASRIRADAVWRDELESEAYLRD